MAVIACYDEPVALIGGGRVTSEDVAWARKYAKRLIAADGGADQALGLGWVPDAVIGDFDSVSDVAREKVGPNRLFPISEQDSTDFDKCLRNVAAPMILGLGFTGRRLDHTLAAFSTLCARANVLCLLLSEEEVIFLCPPELALDMPEGTAFSLYPMGPVQGRSTGLVWPIDGIPMQPDGRVGTSNRVDQAGRVSLTMEGPRMLVILPRGCADAAVAALNQSTRWP
ncbi:thiamine diphosphokinase [Donghicola eburneus]|uniref:thiamine diphosphokinase n=1 Tax=Donghicola eburneus TaxID=393278 RepID=UPI0009324F66|nr:thiamine diphosphokinase [Donghicola eburneus]